MSRLGQLQRQFKTAAFVFIFIVSMFLSARFVGAEEKVAGGVDAAATPTSGAGSASAVPITESQQPGITTDDSKKGLVPAGLWRLGDGLLFPAYALVVDKSLKKIHVIDNSKGSPILIESYDSDLGKLSGDKRAVGDSRTPEGIYFLQKILEGPKLDHFKYGIKAFTTDYPNIFDTRKGKTGYGIWLHAIDESQTLARGSQGCVVVRNQTILKLAPYITLRETPLMIFDKVQWVDVNQAKKSAEPILQVLNDWKLAWQNKDIDKYMSFYAADFKSAPTLGVGARAGGRRRGQSGGAANLASARVMNFDEWKVHKTNLAALYKDIKIVLSMPVIYEHKDTLVVRFYQDYTSSNHVDFGEKTLYMVKNEQGHYEILTEAWQEATNPNAREILAKGPVCCDFVGTAAVAPGNAGK